jgi:alkylation response protein AidB-like acyl-CoA dehydrogenase
MTTADDLELEQLRDALRGFLLSACDEPVVRASAPGGNAIDRALWRRLASELGLPAVGLPELYGGGYGLPALRVVMEELGRALAPVPFLSTVVLSSTALVASGDDAACGRYLPLIADGELIAALAMAEHDGQWADRDWKTRARQTAGRWHLTGEKAFVVDGADADVILVFAATAEGLSLFAVDADTAGLHRAAMTSLDLTRAFAQVSFDAAPAELVGRAGGAESIVAAVGDIARLGLAAENVGGAERCLEMSVDYAKTRQQFGRPIGSFQAIKHLCADMLMNVEGARAATAEAAATATEQPEKLPVEASVAFVESARAFFDVAQETIHVHGGIGFTWEHPAHLYFRRAKSNQLIFGGPAVDYENILTLLGV